MRLKTDANTPCYLYCAAASDGPALPVGGCQLRTFRKGDDATPPNDATAELHTSADESDDLDWLATLAATESLPETPTRLATFGSRGPSVPRARVSRGHKPHSRASATRPFGS